MPPWMAWLILCLTAGTLALLMPLALHRIYLLHLSRRRGPDVTTWSGALPPVTVQLPVYNEAGVIERLIDAAGGLDYPRGLLDIQVLDDSNDDTVLRAARKVSYWQDQGVQIRHLRRPDRDGFKAGALAHGLEAAQGRFVLVLDADFVPPPTLIHDLLGPFRDPAVGMVQARWDHLNEGRSLLTRCQALLLDAHFFFEQGGRSTAGRFMNFNGTAGMWRREALDAGGGWSADTLTEDLDMSYRAQMAGWRFVFLPDVGVPSELPEHIRPLEVQQKRWAQGGVQTARKLLPTLLRGPWPRPVKGEAAVHLLGHLAHPLTLLLGVLLVPSALARRSLGLDHLLPLDFAVFACATASFLIFFGAAGRRRRRPWRSLIPRAVATMTLGIGLTATVSIAVVRGLFGGRTDPFHRTPKAGTAEGTPSVMGYRSPTAWADASMKAILTVWMIGSGVVAWQQGLMTSLPFVLLFGTGYAWLGIGELRDAGRNLRASRGKRRAPLPGDCAPIVTR